MSTIINATTTNGVVIQPDNSGSLVLQTNSGTTAVTIDTSQNVGIGTTTPSTFLQIGGSIVGSNATYPGQVQINGEPTLLQQTAGLEFKTSSFGSGYGWKISSISTGAGVDLVFGTRQNSASWTERMRIDDSGNFKFNSGYGSVATAYGCRAWVNFNGTGTVAIRASGNVSSITDNGTGDYTVNFTTAMPDANYATNVNAVRNSAADTNMDAAFNKNDTYSSSAVRFRTVVASVDTRTAEDAFQAFVSVFR